MDERAQDRLWEHRQRVNEDFNSISNRFMLTQSFLLLVATSEGASGEGPRIAVTFLGFTLTLLWAYVQSKQKFLLDILRRRCAQELPEYAVTSAERVHPLWRFSNTWITAVVLPSIFAITWAVILFFKLR